MKKTISLIALLCLCCTILSAQISKPKLTKKKVGKTSLVADWEENYKSSSSSDKFDIGTLCTKKYKMFSDYFKNIGIIYSTLGRDYHEEDTKEYKK